MTQVKNSTDNLEGAGRIKGSEPADCVLIGITGPARSGKDTVADILLHIFTDFERYSFATPIKDMILAGLELEDKCEHADEMYAASYRKIAQTLGTEWGRNVINPDIWLLIAQKRAVGKHLIITDVRFENEAEWIRRNGLLIHVEREEHEEELEGTEAAHESEVKVQCKHGDYKILNLWDLHQLLNTVRGCAPEIRRLLGEDLNKPWGLDELEGVSTEEKAELMKDDLHETGREEYPVPVAPPTYAPTHGEMVAKLAKSGEEILKSLTPNKCHLWHMASGVGGEAGEVEDVIKKYVAYNGDLKLDKLIEEMGDLEFYLEGLRQGIGISREQILKANIAKLGKRYEGFQYTDTAAKERADKKEEELRQEHGLPKL